jgi:hypothetical protein
MSQAATPVVTALDRLGRLRFSALFALALASALWLALGMAVCWSRQPPALIDASGVAMGHDFVSPFAAASLVLAGEPAAAYDTTQLHATERRVIGAPIDLTPFLYPPTVLMLVAPLALLPYLAALALSLSGQIVFFMRMVYRLVPHPLACWAGLLWPATADSLIAGQNGILSAGLVAAGLLHLERRPLAAGLFFGMLSYKPHMAVAAFAALLFGAHWRTLAAGAATALALAAASAIVFGIEPWLAFAKNLGYARALLEDGQISWDKLVTPFAAARLLDASLTTAWLLQAVVSAGALAALAYVWRRPTALAWRGSVLAVAIPLTTPYAFFYDLAPVFLAMAWLAAAGQATGFRRGEAMVLALAWVAPVAGFWLAGWCHLLLTPLVLVLLLVVILRRVAATTADNGSIAAAPALSAG